MFWDVLFFTFCTDSHTSTTTSLRVVSWTCFSLTVIHILQIVFVTGVMDVFTLCCFASCSYTNPISLKVLKAPGHFVAPPSPVHFKAFCKAFVNLRHFGMNCAVSQVDAPQLPEKFDRLN